MGWGAEGIATGHTTGLPIGSWNSTIANETGRGTVLLAQADQYHTAGRGLANPPSGRLDCPVCPPYREPETFGEWFARPENKLVLFLGAAFFLSLSALTITLIIGIRRRWRVVENIPEVILLTKAKVTPPPVPATLAVSIPTVPIQRVTGPIKIVDTASRPPPTAGQTRPFVPTKQDPIAGTLRLVDERLDAWEKVEMDAGRILLYGNPGSLQKVIVCEKFGGELTGHDLTRLRWSSATSPVQEFRYIETGERVLFYFHGHQAHVTRETYAKMMVILKGMAGRINYTANNEAAAALHRAQILLTRKFGGSWDVWDIPTLGFDEAADVGFVGKNQHDLIYRLTNDPRFWFAEGRPTRVDLDMDYLLEIRSRLWQSLLDRNTHPLNPEEVADLMVDFFIKVHASPLAA